MATVKESATGVLFPSSCPPPGIPGKALSVLGLGVREKKVVLINVKIYAAACHVDSDAAKAALSAFTGKDAKALAKDEAFFTAISEGTFETCLTLTFVRDITQAQFVDALKESLDPKLKAKGAPADLGKTFLESFHGFSFTTNSRVYMTLMADKVHVAGLKAADVPSDTSPPADLKTVCIESPVLGTCVKMCYFGKDSVTPSLKTGVAEGAATLLK